MSLPEISSPTAQTQGSTWNITLFMAHVFGTWWKTQSKAARTTSLCCSLWKTERFFLLLADQQHDFFLSFLTFKTWDFGSSFEPKPCRSRCFWFIHTFHALDKGDVTHHCHPSVPPSFTVHHEAPPKAEDVYQVASERRNNNSELCHKAFVFGLTASR